MKPNYKKQINLKFKNKINDENRKILGNNYRKKERMKSNKNGAREKRVLKWKY
jgi:hypothetical protein